MPDATPVYDTVSRSTLSALLILTLVGCASTPVPSVELTRAREAVERAQSEGAADFAPVDYRMARDALDRGRAQIESRDNSAAQESLQLAQARGELAAAKSVGARLRADVATKEAENQRLRRELLSEGQVP